MTKPDDTIDLGAPRLTYNQCPEHGVSSISIDNDRIGTRVTPGKCCGRWDIVREFRLSAREWHELERLAAEAAETMEEQGAV